MRLQRIGNSGVCHAPLWFSVFWWSKRFWQWESIVAISWCEQTLSGVSRDSVDTRFWDRHSYNPSPSDVILRTGCIVECNEIISQQHYVNVLFYSPLIVAGQSNGCPMVPGSQRHSCSFRPQLRDGHKVIAHQVPNGTKFNHHVTHSRFDFWEAIQFKQTWNRDVYCDWLVKTFSGITIATNCLPDFLEPPVNPQSDENRNLRRYAHLMRRSLMNQWTPCQKSICFLR